MSIIRSGDRVNAAARWREAFGNPCTGPRPTGTLCWAQLTPIRARAWTRQGQDVRGPVVWPWLLHLPRGFLQHRQACVCRREAGIPGHRASCCLSHLFVLSQALGTRGCSGRTDGCLPSQSSPGGWLPRATASAEGTRARAGWGILEGSGAGLLQMWAQVCEAHLQHLMLTHKHAHTHTHVCLLTHRILASSLICTYMFTPAHSCHHSQVHIMGTCTLTCKHRYTQACTCAYPLTRTL